MSEAFELDGWNALDSEEAFDAERNKLSEFFAVCMQHWGPEFATTPEQAEQNHRDVLVALAGKRDQWRAAQGRAADDQPPATTTEENQ